MGTNPESHGLFTGASPQRGSKPDVAEVDFARAPFLVIWETTRACDLKCVHCRAEAIPLRHPRELTLEEGCGLIDQVREFGRPLFVLTGGDPLKRPDIFDLIRHGDAVGLRVAMTPSGTSLMTPGVIARLRDSGLARLAVSLDGSRQEVHDGFRQVDGSFDWTMAAIEEARRCGLPVQVNTTVSKHNLKDLPRIARLLEKQEIVLWSVFCLVPTGRGVRSDVISAREHEKLFERLYEWSKTLPFDIKTTAGQHYRRVVQQRRAQEVAERVAQGVAPEEAEQVVLAQWSRGDGPGGRSEPGGWTPGNAAGGAGSPAGDARAAIGRAAKGVNDGNGMVFVDHIGQIYPSGFLPVVVGDVRRDRLADVYRAHPVLTALRDPGRLEGKCGQCEFRDVCGGSRARAFAVTGNYLASEPYCTHKPQARPVA